MGWNKGTIQGKDGKPLMENGKSVIAMQPEIVSASRSTDIPAFYADWFIHRLKVGYSAWINPFNHAKSYVSYENTRFIVFWSKNPKPLLEHLDYILEERKIGCYVQYTLNDYEEDRLETGVPPIEERVETFKALSKRLGKEAVIWRFDPMILLKDAIDIDCLIAKVERLGDQLHEYTTKLVFSYADISLYKKVKRNLDKGGIPYQEWTEGQMEELARRLAELNERKGWKLQLATCGEKIDTSKYGIAHNRCIDGDLIVRLAWKDKELMKAMKVKIQHVQSDLFSNDETQKADKGEIPKGAIPLPDGHYFYSVHKKDKGQRELCQCMAAKDIGEYNTCKHLCEYCYANTSKEDALRNYDKHGENRFADTITGE